MNSEILTIGHSTQSISDFLALLAQQHVTALADVRSAPYSRHNPQFNRESLSAALKDKGIKYVFLGKELGARSDDECCYVDNKVSYALLAKTKLFQKGIARILEGASSYRVALMCAEKDPLDCHRTILVARELVRRGEGVSHILSDGRLESHADAISRLVRRLGIGAADMFRSQESTIEEAYEIQGEAIAYERNAPRRPLMHDEHGFHRDHA